MHMAKRGNQKSLKCFTEGDRKLLNHLIKRKSETIKRKDI